MSDLPVTPPNDITVPSAGSTTAKQILSAYLRQQYRTLATLPFERLIDAPEGAAFTARVRALAKSDPGLLFSILRRPTVGGLIRLIRAQDGNRTELGAWSRELMAQFSFEMAVSGQGEGEVPVDPMTTRLVSLQRGFSVEVPAGTQRAVFDGSRVTFQVGGSLASVDASAPTEAQRATYAPLAGAPVLATFDNNPRAGVEAHPDKDGNHVDLGEQPVSAWTESLNDALGLVRAGTPEIAEEIDLLIHQFVPVGYEPEKHLSASLMEVIGNIYLTLHPNPLVMAEAVVHEFSHNKINALWSMAPLLENAFTPLYASPVRPDPRPLFGVLLAVHAFLPVEAMYRSLAEQEHPVTRHPRFNERLARVRASNAEAAETVLTNGQATPMGESVLAEIDRLNQSFAAQGA